ncbi:MAG: aldose 1-epimerase [Solirubrobacterales bacterium]|nr:aldose 1-epimerase [Solirubrobacterales bacterium]
MDSAEGFDSITLTSADGSTSAEFVPDANLVCCSLAVGGVEWLERRRGVRAYAEQGKTMGIPLLYPWANRLARFGYSAAGRQVVLSEDDARIPRDSAGLPIHGVLPGLLRWEPGDSGRPDTVTARLEWSSGDLLELFPFVHEVHCEATVGTAELAVTTTVTAVGEDRLPVSFGYHPYTRLPGARDGSQITLAASNRLVLDDHSIPTGERAPVGRDQFPLEGASLDDAFVAVGAAPEPARFEATCGQGRLSVEFLGGYGYAQVFSPDGEEFVCFEPMTAPANALNSGDGLTIVGPGETYLARFRIAVSQRA